jgi:hypothetical protein
MVPAIDGTNQTLAMGGFIDSVGDGITGLVSGAFAAIGGALRGIVNAGNQALPGGLFILLAFVLVVVVGWSLAKR